MSKISSSEEDFYIAMLRYGKSKLETGFRQDDLVTYLHEKGYDIKSVHSNLLIHYFPLTFFAKDETKYPDHVSFYYLKPEAYFNLLNHDNIQTAEESAKQANIIAIISIILTLLSVILSLVLSIL